MYIQQKATTSVSMPQKTSKNVIFGCVEACIPPSSMCVYAKFHYDINIKSFSEGTSVDPIFSLLNSIISEHLELICFNFYQDCPIINI